jgi:hypothetical protein
LTADAPKIVRTSVARIRIIGISGAVGVGVVGGVAALGLEFIT